MHLCDLLTPFIYVFLVDASLIDHDEPEQWISIIYKTIMRSKY
jgi:hypothetical protein